MNTKNNTRERPQYLKISEIKENLFPIHVNQTWKCQISKQNYFETIQDNSPHIAGWKSIVQLGKWKEFQFVFPFFGMLTS